jgi:DNA-binding IclR family transcriptional regulator
MNSVLYGERTRGLAMDQRSYRVPALEHAIAVLRFLKERNYRPWGVSELSRSLRLNKSTCFNILRTLKEAGFVAWDQGTKKFSLGTALIELGGAVAAASTGAVVAKPFLLDLFEDVRLTCLLGRRFQDKVVIIDKAEVLDDVRVTVPLGQVVPLGTGAMGKSFLLGMRETEAIRILQRHVSRGVKNRRAPTVARLRRELREARRRGFVESFGEVQAGIHSVAAPVFDHEGHVTLAVGALGLSTTLPPRVLARYGRKVKEVADLISRTMGGRMRQPHLFA